MQSLTKQEVPYDKIHLMVQKTFFCKPQTVEEMHEGYFNATYHIRLESGKDVVLKVAPKDNVRVMSYEKNIMYTEVTMLQKMKNFTSVAVPAMYYYDAAKTILDSEYFFMEYLDGDSLHKVRKSLTKETQKTIDEELGKVNRLINSVHGTKFGYFGRKTRQRSSWYEAFYAMLNDILGDCRHYNIDLHYDQSTFVKHLEKDRSCFDEVKTPCLVHWDLWDGNIFIKDGEIQGIIDWERCLWADPLMESGFRTHNHNEAFYRGYGMVPFSPTEQRRVYWYDLYLCLTWIVEYYCREYQDEFFFKNMWKQYADATMHLNL